MKVFQTIYTSAVTTLENRQGLGRVFCSKGLPEPIREKIAHYEYDSDAAGAPIYSFERMPLSGKTWLLLNRAVPAVDYTGRTSCVSHTLAFCEADLLSMSERRTGLVPTVFEFAKNFHWAGTWEGEPRWEVDEEILTLEKAFDSARSAGPTECQLQSSAFLLAFGCGEGGLPRPKCAAWKFADQSPEEILDFFDRVWHSVDPWNGTRNYKDILGEPDMGPVSSWHCTFTTNLRNNDAKHYEWVVLSPKVPIMPSRETLVPSIWEALGDDEIKAKIANGIPDLLVERIREGPENWARRKLREKLEDLKKDYQTQVKERHSKLASEAGDLLGELEDKIKESEKWIEVAKAKKWLAFSDANVEFLGDLEKRLNVIKNKARDASKDLFENYRNSATPIRSLLLDSPIDDAGKEANPVFEEQFRKKNDLVIKWKEIAPLEGLCVSLNEWMAAYDCIEEERDKLRLDKEEITAQKNEQYTKADRLLSENERLNRKLLASQKGNAFASTFTKNPWFWLSCGIFALLVVFALLIVSGVYPNNKLKPEIANLLKQVEDLKNQNKNLKEEQRSTTYNSRSQKGDDQGSAHPQYSEGDSKPDTNDSQSPGADKIRPNTAPKDKPSRKPTTTAPSGERGQESESDEKPRKGESEENKAKEQKKNESNEKPATNSLPQTENQKGSPTESKSNTTPGSGTKGDENAGSVDHPAPLAATLSSRPSKPASKRASSGKPTEKVPTDK